MHVHAVIAAIAAADAAPAARSQSDWVAQVLIELGRSQAAGFILDVCRWTLLGAVLGAMTAMAGCVLFSRLGWYDIRGRFARGLRWMVYVVTVILATVLVGLAGVWQGAVHGSERVLTKSRLATDVFPLIANAIADGMAWVQVHAASPGDTNSPELAAKLEDFRAGKWELQAAEFQRQLDELQEAVITSVVARLERSALENAPQLRGGLSEILLRQFLSGLGRRVLQGSVPGQPQGWGAGSIYSAVREQLRTEAAKAGNPETIARTEISTFVVREGIVPGLMGPIRAVARTQQTLLAVVAVLVLIVPPVCIQVVRSWLGPAERGNPIPPPAPSGSP